LATVALIQAKVVKVNGRRLTCSPQNAGLVIVTLDSVTPVHLRRPSAHVSTRQQVLLATL